MELYEDEVLNRGGPLEIKFFKSIPSYYAFASIDLEGNHKVSIMGGNLTNEYMTLDSLALLVCHELGHFLGGAPKRIYLDPEEDQEWNTVEGQADYFSTLKCMKRYTS